MTFRAPLIIGIARARFAAPTEYVVNLNLVLHFPNPKQPFIQSDWPRTIDLPKLKAVGEPIGRVNPLLTPNPAQPFAQYDWRLATSPLPPLKSDVYSYYKPLAAVVAAPFYQSLWDDAARVPPKATGEYDQSIFVVTAPFVESDWLLAPVLPKAKVDDIINLVVGQVVVPSPSHQLWENPAKPLPKAAGEAVSGVAPLLTPNPTRPFAQFDWPSISATRNAKVDDFANRLPYQVVVAVSPPFYQSLWEDPSRVSPKATGEYDQGIFVVPSPFVQSDWLWASPALKAKVDDPFYIAPIYSPNPAQPFNQGDWPRIPFTVRGAQADTVELLLPIYSPPPVVGLPFSNPTETRTFAFQTVKSDIFVNPLPLQAQTTPFSQGDWPVANFGPWHSDPGLAPPLNPNLYPPPPPPVLANYLHAKPLFVTMGKMLHIPGDVITTSALPPDGLIAEDGVTFLVAEDGTTFLVKE